MLWISILANAAGFMSVERETNIVTSSLRAPVCRDLQRNF